MFFCVSDSIGCALTPKVKSFRNLFIEGGLLLSGVASGLLDVGAVLKALGFVHLQPSSCTLTRSLGLFSSLEACCAQSETQLRTSFACTCVTCLSDERDGHVKAHNIIIAEKMQLLVVL